MPEPGNMARPKLTGVGDWAHSKLAGSNVSPAVNGLGIQGVEKISGKSNTKNLLDRIAKEFSPRAPGDSGNSGSSGAGLTDAQKEHMRKYPILEPGSWEWRESSGFSWDSLMDGAELVKEHLEDVESAAKGNEMATAEMQGELNAFAAEQGPKGELQMYAKQHLAKGEERIQAVLSRFAEEHHRIAAMIQELGRITMDGNALQAAHGKWDLRQDERLRLLHAHMEEFQAPDALQGFSLQPFLRRAAQVSADVDAIMSGVGEPIETGVDAHKAFLHKEAVRLRALIFAPHGLLDQAREELEDSSKAAFDALDAKLAAAHEGIGGSLSTVVAVAGQVESGLAVMSRAVLGQLQGLEDAEAALQGHISAAVGVLRGAVEENTAELAALQGFLAVIAQRQVHNLAPCQAASLTTRALRLWPLLLCRLLRPPRPRGGRRLSLSLSPLSGVALRLLRFRPCLRTSICTSTNRATNGEDVAAKRHRAWQTIVRRGSVRKRQGPTYPLIRRALLAVYDTSRITPWHPVI